MFLVRFAPDLTKTPLTVVKTWELNPVNMTCIAEAIPNATINWWFRGRQLFSSQESFYHITDANGVSILHIKPSTAVGSSHGDIYGSYKCEAFNPLGRAEITIQLDQAYRPSAIVQAAYEKLTPTTVTFRIDGPLNDGGLPIKTIWVQYRKKHEEWQQYEKRMSKLIKIDLVQLC